MRARSIGAVLFALVVVVAVSIAVATRAPLAPSELDEAEVLAAAVRRLVTVDHGFGADSPPPFTGLHIANAVGGLGGTLLKPLQLEAVAAAANESGIIVQYIDNPASLIRKLFDEAPQGAAVLTVESLRLEPGRAEVELHLWCGSLCGVYITYEAVIMNGTWIITGPVGPIAMS